jgi:hypothetical protein
MPLEDRDYTREKHPPNCTCVDCVNRRLGIVKYQKLKDKREPGKLPDAHSEPPISHMPVTKTNNRKPPNWLTALLFVISLSGIGLGVSYYVGSFIPFWILFGFSIIYSIEKWFSYITRKFKAFGKLYRLLLNFSILALFGLLVWSGIKLFTQQFTSNYVAGSLIFLAELVFFVWMWRVVSKNSWRWPSMKLTTSCLIVIFVILAFAGVNPFNKYKDNAINKISNYFAEMRASTIEGENESIGFTQSIAISPTITTTLKPTKSTTQLTPTITQPQLKDPTWVQLVSFLQNDKTDQRPYVYPTFVCYDFACTLQDNAHEAGWKCAIVEVQLSGYPDFYDYGIPSNTGHECNLFQTTDRGSIYIDCTGMPADYPHPIRMVKTVDVQVGQDYIPVSLFPEAGWNNTWDNMGKIVDIKYIEW